VFDMHLVGSSSSLASSTSPDGGGSAPLAPAPSATPSASRTTYTGLIVDGAGSRASGSVNDYSFDAAPLDPKGRVQMVMAVLRKNRTQCNSNASFQRICHNWFWEAKCSRAKCYFAHERPSDAQMRGASMSHLIGQGVSKCCVDANGSPRGAIGGA
jgi:hypothetical protein